MLSTILSAFTVPEIRKKLAFTALLLALYRLGSHIPVPGVTMQAKQEPGFSALAYESPGSAMTVRHSGVRCVGCAKRSVPTASNEMVGTARDNEPG